MPVDVEALGAEVMSRYTPEEFPALWSLITSGRQPLAGVTVLNAFPVFHNTLAHYWALVAAGADLTVVVGSGIPDDPAITRQLPGWGIPVVRHDEGPAADFDVVLDTAGHHARQSARYGYVELTKSGEAAYDGCAQPVFLVDAGRIKLIENTLGTGDGFMRAMAQLGHPITPGQRVVVVGAGKVGLGVVGSCRAVGARVTVIDTPERLAALAARLPSDVDPVDSGDPVPVRAAIQSADCVCTATGVAAAVAPYAQDLMDSPALLANMGAEDEFGPSVPAGRVLNGKAPANFVLPEPTRLRYIDPSLALAVVGTAEVVAGRLAPGINPPPADLEEQILAVVRDHGAVASDLATLGLWGIGSQQEDSHEHDADTDRAAPRGRDLPQ